MLEATWSESPGCLSVLGRTLTLSQTRYYDGRLIICGLAVAERRSPSGCPDRSTDVNSRQAASGYAQVRVPLLDHRR